MKPKIKLALKILLALQFVLGGINHFRDAPFYLNMMPDYVPAHALVVQLSGVTEMIAGVMLLIPAVSRWGARFIIAHLVVFLSVHFWMVQHADRYADTPVAALWVRIVIQFVLIAWAAWFINDGATDADLGRTRDGSTR